MKTMTVGEIKTHFSEVLKAVEAGEKVAITFGRKKVIKALLVPNEPLKAERKKKRKIGLLEGKGSFKFIGGHNTTEEEFFGL